MSQVFPATTDVGLLDNERLCKKISLNYHRNLEHDRTEAIDKAALRFSYAKCEDQYWNPEEFSFLYGTELWRQASPRQKRVLNHLYWVAYFSQIVSAEIATILFNQTSATGLYGLEDFRAVCDMLDLESSQERAHVAAFKGISERTEKELFGHRLFSYSMRTPFCETMIFPESTRLQSYWRRLQLYAFTMLSSGNAFIACQYFAIRGIRTLNGKLVQHQLSRYYDEHPNRQDAPPPSEISYHHFMDESYHFNSSRILSHDILTLLKPPTRFERWVMNKGVLGCQLDHYHVSSAINGIFWYDPALFPVVYALFLSPVFGLSDPEARQFLWQIFAMDNDGLQRSFQTHRCAVEAYRSYVADLQYLNPVNKEMQIMASNSIDKHLANNRRELEKFFSKVGYDNRR